MKICFVGSAQSIHMQRWAKWFVDKGYETHLITSSLGEIDGVKVHLIGNGKENSPFNFVRKIIQTRKLVRKIKPDILHAHYVFGPGTFGVFAGYHPFIVSVWGSDIVTDFKKSIFHKLVITHSLKRADIIHVGDSHTRERLIHNGVKKNKIFIQPWGIDINSFNPNVRSEELRKELNVEKYMVLSTNPWSSIRNVDVLVKAIPPVVKEINDVKFVLLGGGPLEGELKALARTLGIEKHIVFVERVPHKEMPKYLASSDILVDTANTGMEAGGGIGVANMEAMGCGVPLLLEERAYLKGKGQSLIDEYWYCSLVYEQWNSRDLSEKIIMLLTDEKMRREIGDKEIEIAKSIGDWNKNMENMEKLMTEKVKKHES